MAIHILYKKPRKTGRKSAKKLISDAAISFERKKQRRHELWILTCYVNLDLVEKYTDHLLKIIRLTDVYLAFDFAEIYKETPCGTKKKLDRISKNLQEKEINFEWQALASSKLVHSKGYAIIQRVEGVVAGGLTLITSANFTRSGFEGQNIELGYLSQKKKDIRAFESAYDSLWEELGKEIDQAIFQQNAYLFKFGLLSSGVFLHKWAGNLKQQLGIKYELTPLAQKRGSIAPELAEVGFEAGDIFTRQVIDVEELPAKEVPRAFITKFTIETYWGRWCPLDAWETLCKSFKGSKEFVDKFEKLTEQDTLEHIKNKALNIQNDLIAKGLIEPVKQEHLDNWVKRINGLRADQPRLERFFTGYETHPLPYQIEQQTEIKDLFRCLEEAIELSKVKNTAKKKVVQSIKTRNIEFINLTNDEKQTIDGYAKSPNSSKIAS